VGPWNIELLADEFRDMEQRLRSSVDAAEAEATDAPADWIRYAETKGISIPWLDYAREEVPDFAWPSPVQQRVTVGVDRETIMSIFPVRSDPAKNTKYWDGILSDVPVWLKDAIMQRGRAGVSHRWDVLRVAHAIARKKLMTAAQLDRAIRQYDDRLFERWQTETELDRT
jgi:hypothetical protein